MFLELSEILVCPRCRPAQGLIVMVDRLEDRRVVAGDLGCPRCEARYPVRRGLILFGEVPPAEPGGGGDAAIGEGGSGGEGRRAPPGRTVTAGEAALFRGAAPAEAAARLAALLGVPVTDGPLVLGQGLAGLAGELAARAPGVEVLALGPGGGTEEGAPPRAEDAGAVTRIVGVSARDLPFFSGRMDGVALLAPSAAGVEEAVRILGEGGRLVLVEPGPEAKEAADVPELEVAADDERALVAVRRR